MKKAFNIVANVCAIVLMFIMFIGALMLLNASIDAGVGFGYLQVITLALLLFSIGTIIVSSVTLVKGSGAKGNGLKITVIALVGIIAVLEFVGGGIVYGFLALIPVGFEIASLCVKDDNKAAEKGNVTHTDATVDQKIAELKHLKELRALTDEQYEQAV